MTKSYDTSRDGADCRGKPDDFCDPSVQHQRVMSARHRRPPFQLVEGDRHNLCLGLLAAFSLASCKDNDWLNKRISPFLRWQLNA